MVRRYTYGPFQSRRLGLSLGVDVLQKHKICTYNCVYCEIGVTEKIVSPEYRFSAPPTHEFRKELLDILRFFPNLNSISFGYNGEPTLNENLSDFLNIATEVRDKLNWIEEKPKLTLFTNSSTLHFEEIRRKVKKFELILAKLDVSNQDDFIRTNRPHPEIPNIETIINSLIQLKKEISENNKLAIQVLIYNSYKQDFISNNNSKNINILAQALKKIKPDIVQIYSTARIPAEYFVYSIDDNDKREIVNELKLKIGNNDIKIDYY
ncbi:MAG: hypothetical protein ACFFDH_11405 [Promethearchaeota archaeon]